MCLGFKLQWLYTAIKLNVETVALNWKKSKKHKFMCIKFKNHCFSGPKW
jgi:hypothetical protein